MFNLAYYINRQREWSKKTFGPGKRTMGISKHIQYELLEVQAEPNNPREWIDIVILALDGAWRAGAEPDVITELLKEKQKINFNREFPYPKSENHVSEHIEPKE